MGVEYKALFNDSNLRVVAGGFKHDETTRGDGFTVSDDATTGEYTLTFNRVYGTMLSFVATAEGLVGDIVSVKTDYSASAGTIVLQLGDDTGAGKDLATGDFLNFVAVFQE
jgi:hypothetical protein